MIQITDNAKEQQLIPVFRLAFRPFFLAGSIFSVISLLLWGGVLSGEISITSMMSPTIWHAHEMLFGFSGAIILGFLLTAVQNWTGYPGLKGTKLAIVFFLWLAGRIAIFSFPPELFWLTMLLELSWMPLAALALGIAVVHSKQWRNLFFVPLLLVMSILNGLSLWGVKSNDYITSLNAIWSMLFLVFFIVALMGGRVIPFFTSKGTSTDKAQPILALEIASLVPLLLLAVLTWIPETNEVSAIVAIIAGLANTIRVIRWKPLITLPVPLLWSLHLSYLLLSTGLLFYALALFIPEFNAVAMIHLTAIGGIAGVILAMISRVSLGHTGRSLKPSKWMSVAFIFIALSALVRVFLPLFSPNLPFMTYWISILCWSIAFILFTICYSRMLVSARLDNKPG